MKKLIPVTIILTVIFCFSYLIIFEGEITKVKSWWSDLSRNSENLPLSPYKTRIEDAQNLIIEGANQIFISDTKLFWKGYGAKADVYLEKDNYPGGIIVRNGGQGYSKNVRVSVTGASSQNFEINDINIVNGTVKGLNFNKLSTWSREPLAFIKDEKEPYTGKVVQKYFTGQIIEESSYLAGKLHGKIKQFNIDGSPKCEKDYVQGKKHGTHIYWYEKPIDPSDYIPKTNSIGEKPPTYWLHLKDDSKENYNISTEMDEANKWVLKTYRMNGGSFQVKLLEHWKDDLKHGLFEAFDKIGNKKFKDEYKDGLRVKHQIFDKQK